MTLASTVSAVKRTPVEIWRRIFELYLGPSLLEPEESTPAGYLRLIRNECLQLRNYVSMERERGVLRRVCRSWDELAGTMGDRIVISHLDEDDWPPHRNRRDAKYISYRNWTPRSDRDPVSVFRCRIGRENSIGLSELPIKLDSSLPLAQITKFSTSRIELSPIGSEIGPADIDHLCLGPGADLHDIAHPLFYNVRILQLACLYPFEEPDGIKKSRSLPNLRCLILQADARDHPRAPTSPLSIWHFPKLAMFHVSPWGPLSRPTDDLRDFIQNHAATLEELDIPSYASAHCAKYTDWSRFHRLRSIKSLDLPSIADVIPLLTRRWEHIRASNNILDASDAPLLTIGIYLALTELSAEDMLARLWPHQWAFPYLKIQMQVSLDNMLKTIKCTGPESARYVSKFFAVIDELRLTVVDSEGDHITSDKANALRTLVLQNTPATR